MQGVYSAYWAYCNMQNMPWYGICIFCILGYIFSLHILHIVLHIAAYFIAYFFAYCIKLHILQIVHIKLHIIHIILHIILHILHIDFIYILCILCISNCIFVAYFFAYSVAYLAYWQECIFYIFWHMLHITFTYHHLQPSRPFSDLSQKAPGKSADSRRMAKGIVPVAPTGTRGRRPSMEDTGITYKTCACSRRS